MGLVGCTTGTHSAEREEVKVEEKKIVLPSYFDENGKECYGTPPPPPSSNPTTTGGLAPLPAAPIDTIAPGKSTETVTKLTAKEIAAARIEEQDDETMSESLVKGSRCKRRGCEVDWDGETREGEECWFHPGAVRLSLFVVRAVETDRNDQPEFREGSKGYGCCSRRVLDFDDFRASPLPFTLCLSVLKQQPTQSLSKVASVLDISTLAQQNRQSTPIPLKNSCNVVRIIIRLRGRCTSPSSAKARTRRSRLLSLRRIRSVALLRSLDRADGQCDE